MTDIKCPDINCQADKISKTTVRWWAAILGIPVAAALLYMWSDNRSMSYVFADRAELAELDKRVQLREITANHILETLSDLRTAQAKMQSTIEENTKLLIRLNGLRNETR